VKFGQVTNMVKGLAKRIGIIGAVVGGLMLGSCSKNYKIDDNKVEKVYFMGDLISVVEHKGKDRIVYKTNFMDEAEWIKIDGKKYGPEYKVIYQEGSERLKYLLNQAHSMDQSKDEKDLSKKIEREQGEINKALKILKK